MIYLSSDKLLITNKMSSDVMAFSVSIWVPKAILDMVMVSGVTFAEQLRRIKTSSD